MLKPLAERLRPDSLEQVLGQRHILAPGQPLFNALKGQGLHSMILWGPPGTGKTTMAKLVCSTACADWHQLSAVSSGVKDIRHIMNLAEENRAREVSTLLFIDEVHRFNKAQQDAFLPQVEDGTLCLIGATTENPAFELNNALLSRARVYVLKTLDEDTLACLINHALETDELLLSLGVSIDKQAQSMLAKLGDGDARRVLGFLETAADLAQDSVSKIIGCEHIEAVVSVRLSHFDKGGDHFYDQISALHKAVRGSNPDAALYWLTRMLSAGCDPHYLLRRVLRMASEDIGNADPRALSLVSAAWDAYDRLGSPEGELAISQAVIYLAVAPKSNAVYRAAKLAGDAVKAFPTGEVPIHLRNAPTKLAKSMGHGEDYRYAHDETQAFSPGQGYFPEEMDQPVFYEPVNRGLEIKISDKLRALRKLDNHAKNPPLLKI